MKKKLLIAAAAVTFALPAFADFEVVSEAYEMSLVDVTVPPSRSGRLAFKECGDCETKSIRMAREARFLLNGRIVRFDGFRAAVQKIGNRSSASVTVKHHLASDTVTSVSVNFKQ
ncbi:MAG: hypothetical protein ACR2QZ_16920 [Woeseiaceae bacterium]